MTVGATRALGLPTRPGDWRLMVRTARLVLTIPRYAALGVAAAAAGLTISVWSLNPSLVSYAMTGGGLAAIDRVVILLELYPFLGTAFGPVQGAVLLVVAILVGVDVALVAYHVGEAGLSGRAGGSGAAGVVLGALGAGCAACGTALLAGLLSLLGVTVSVTVLPLDGLEFALLAVVALLVSIHWVTQGMRGGMINGCPVDLQ